VGWGAEVGGNFWRTTGDVGIPKNGTFWNSIDAIGFSQDGKEKWAGPGGWNDPDNINIGQIIWNKKVGPTPLTPNEQYSYVSLWSLLAAPLFFGGDMTKLDDFTLSLLTNDEVIEVNQDVLGKQGRRVWKDGTSEVWAKPLEDGSLAVGLFNRGEAEVRIAANWTALGIQGKHKVRDLWRQRDLGAFDGNFRGCRGAARRGAYSCAITAGNNGENEKPLRIPITDVFDLHSVPPRDVKEVVREYLLQAHRLGFTALRIIHGRG
jgi:alpha-galactosidase